MKDTAISSNFDLAHQQQSWNQQQQQQQHRHLYPAQSHQRANQLQQQPQQQHQLCNQHAISQYQQLQSINTPAHHNSSTAAAVAAAAYYQQAHLYPTYQAHSQDQQQQQQQQQQHQQQQQQQQHQNPDNSQPVSAASSNSAPPPPGQHQAIQHQNSTNNQAWNSASMAAPPPPPHPGHAVVTDHSTLAYHMTHAYQSHGASIATDHRNSNGPITGQPVATAPQASSYTVDSLYNAPAAAAAAAAAAAVYGYNNYNTAFFQASNNGPHSQANHPSPAGMSAFWNHTQQPAQTRTTHSQPVTNQAAVHQRQSVNNEQTANYLHDPRIFYGRPTYDHALQNFGQTPHHTSQSQTQNDLLHQRMTALSQPQLLQHHDQLSQLVTQQQPLHQHSPIGNPTTTVGIATGAAGQHHSPSNQAMIGSTHPQATQQTTTIVQQPVLGSNETGAAQSHRQVGPQLSKSSSQQSSHKQPPLEADAISKSDQFKETNNSNQQQFSSQYQTHTSIDSKDNNASNRRRSPINQSSYPKEMQQNNAHVSTTSNPSIAPSLANRSNTDLQSVIKSEPNYARKAQVPAGTGSQSHNRVVIRNQSDERIRSSESTKKMGNERENRIVVDDPEHDNQAPNPIDLNPSIDESLSSLTLRSSRKTTWASIASKPAQVAQPKSLKSKITGSNSVLSSAKHLAAVSLDVGSADSKNGINPAIKSSVSAAATSIQRSSVPPPVSKLPAAAASLKLNILGEEGLDSSRISWPAVNASINLKLDDPPLKASPQADVESTPIFAHGEKQKREDGINSRDFFQDHNHNQGSSLKSNMSYQVPGRDWSRREQGDNRLRRDSDRKEYENDKTSEHRGDLRETRDQVGVRRDFKNSGTRSNQRGDEPFRERDYNKRSAMLERNDSSNNDGYQNSRYSNNRYSSRNYERAPMNHGTRPSEYQAQHHHYNNVRDGSTAPSKLDLTLHPHLNPANYNPEDFNLEPEGARYFIIKSYSEDDIHRSIKYSIWCSTNHGNKRLDEAYRQQQQVKEGPIYLFFSVNGSGHFCGMAQMTSSVDFESSSGVWAQSKWLGEFSVKWIYVKDVPNNVLRHITLENNEDKPVTNSRDTQEVPSEKGKAVLKILHQYPHTTSLFDDFLRYERRQEESKFKKSHHEPTQGRAEERDRGVSGGTRFGRSFLNARPHNPRFAN